MKNGYHTIKNRYIVIKEPTMSQKLLLEIAQLRDELNSALDQEGLELDKDNILALSTQLDVLILEFIKQA